MKEFSPRSNLKEYARTALAASLPLAAGFSACGDGPTQSGMPAGLEAPTRSPITAPLSPTAQPGRTTITLEAICPPTDPNPPEFYTQEAKRIAAEYGGAIVLEATGLTCEKNYVPYLELILGNVNHTNRSVENIENIQIYGYGDGSQVTQIIPVTSCSAEYALATVDPNKALEPLLVPDEKSNIPYASFVLHEDCVTEIRLGVSTPDLN